MGVAKQKMYDGTLLPSIDELRRSEHFLPLSYSVLVNIVDFYLTTTENHEMPPHCHKLALTVLIFTYLYKDHFKLISHVLQKPHCILNITKMTAVINCILNDMQRLLL